MLGLGEKVTANDKVYLDNQLINKSEEMVYILLNKPTGYVTTLSDEFDRPKITDLIDIGKRLVPVGRLDMYTSGAIILTNDGDFVYKVTHPKHEIEKTYIAKVKGKVQEEHLEKLRKGIRIEDYVTSPAKATIISYDNEKDKSEVEVIIHEGKNRQVRKMFEAIGYEVLRLHRKSVGQLSVENMKLGQWRYLNEEEIRKILDN